MELRVSALLRVENIALECDRYEVTPESILAAHLTAIRRNLNVLAGYHSHPDCVAFPSELDRKWRTPHSVQLILGTRGMVVRETLAWLFTSFGDIKSIPVRTASS
jgi:proteasome lid subunit RPN8/RPN11